MDTSIGGMPRDKFLAQYGLQECEFCKSWLLLTVHARGFHYMRCKG